jgi:beta-lactamase superfamily II metal-dependent hydrolase
MKCLRLSLFLFFSVYSGLSQLFSVSRDIFLPELIVKPPEFVVSIKNVGQGSCTIIRNLHNNSFLVIDAGSISHKPLGATQSILYDLGMSEINPDLPTVQASIFIVVSHTDKDHINLFKEIFGPNSILLRNIHTVFLGDHFSNYFRIAETKSFVDNFLRKIPVISHKLLSLSHHLTSLDLVEYLSNPDRVDISRDFHRGFKNYEEKNMFVSDLQRSGGARLGFLGVNAGKADGPEEGPLERDTNTNSAVVRLSFAGKNIIIMGDATGKTTDRILEETDDSSLLEAELLVSGHHGADSDETNSIAWAAVTKPKSVVFSAGFNKGYKHPSLTALSHYLATGLDEDEERMHELAVYNPIGKHVMLLHPSIRGLYLKKVHADEHEWVVFETSKKVYNTTSSGDLSFTYNLLGDLVLFDSEY